VTAPNAALARRAVPRPGRIGVDRVTAKVPRPGSQEAAPTGENTVGATGDGQIVLQDRVVSRIASRAASEVDGVGSAAPRVLGMALAAPGLDRLGSRTDDLRALPTVAAQVDGRRVFVTVTASVAYPQGLADTAQQVRDRVTDRVAALTGLDVAEVDVHVTALVVDGEPSVRVR